MGIGSGSGLAPNRHQAITWTNADPVLWRLYAALGGDESTDKISVWYLFNYLLVVCAMPNFTLTTAN